MQCIYKIIQFINKLFDTIPPNKINFTLSFNILTKTLSYECIPANINKKQLFINTVSYLRSDIDSINILFKNTPADYFTNSIRGYIKHINPKFLKFIPRIM